MEGGAEARAALEALLRAGGIGVLAVFGRVEDAVASIERLRPDVALVELREPGMLGVAKIRQLHRGAPGLKVLVLSFSESVEDIVGALGAGASGYLCRGTPPEEVRGAIEELHLGATPLSPAVARCLVERVQRSAARGSGDARLTDREREVLALLARGHTYASVATALQVTLSTVQSHVKRVYRKLEIASKAEAATAAARLGLLDG